MTLRCSGEQMVVSVVVIGLIIGFAGVMSHNDRALVLGIVPSLGGLWAAIDFR
jgi:hypothetical protein